MQLTPERLQRIPHAPGVYTFTKRGIPIYVGKAADLRARLAAYTPGKDWKTDMVAAATGLRIEATDSELEALLLEANYITVFRPRYNIADRDQKTFLSILVTTDEEFPQVLPTRSHARAGTYFGPFTSAHAVRETLRALRKIFPYRCALKPQADSRKLQVPHLPSPPLPEGGGKENISPPHAGRGSERGWGDAHASRLTSHARPCLSFHLGQCAGTCAGLITAEEYRRCIINPLLRILHGHAKSARRLLDPEHQRLLDNVLNHTRILSVTEKYAADLHDLQRVLHLPSLPRRIEGYDISNIHGIEAVGSMVVAVDGEPAPSEYKKFKIKTLEGKSNDVGMLREVLTRRFAHTTARGVTRSGGLLLRASTEHSGGAQHQDSERDQTQEGPSSGYSSKMVQQKELWPNPDLLLIDGGKAQLNAVLRVMRGAGVSFPVVALAKREEEVFLPGERAPLRLPRNSPTLHLLERVRDEAHRFAISYHRARYRKRLLRG